jgi:hypothetical protein
MQEIDESASGAHVSLRHQRPLGSGKVGAKQLRRTDRTLCFFIMALQGHEVVIELRSNTFLKGIVYMADVHWKCASLQCWPPWLCAEFSLD